MNTNNLNDWLKHIESFHPSDIALGLDRIKQVAERLVLLSPSAKVILVAGTNGKGSCVAMLESTALTQNKSVATYTSPHLVCFNERIRINGINVQDSQLVEAFQVIEKNRDGIALTFFEFTTLAALYVFKQQSLDLIVLEVGLGGRQDATNIIEPDVSVITTVDKDHASWLGDELPGIAYEKGGIIRLNKPAFIGDDKTLKLIHQVLPEFITNAKLINHPSAALSHAIGDQNINRYSLLAQNILLAKSAFETCYRVKLDHELFVKAIQNVKIQGRFQQLDTKIHTIVDVAHNAQSAFNLAKQVKLFCQNNTINQVTAICGMMSDKAIDKVFEAITPVIDFWCFTDLEIPRASKAVDLQKIYQNSRFTKSQKSTADCNCFQQVGEAYEWILRQGFKSNIDEDTPKKQLVLVFGSFITVANMLQYNQTNINDSKNYGYKNE